MRRVASGPRARRQAAIETASTARPTAERNLVAEQRQRRLRQALRRLPIAQRQAVVLAHYEGMTQTEIAQLEEIPLGTVKTRTSLAMRKLRAALASEAVELL